MTNEELVTKALEALVQTMRDYQAPASERVHAAQLILEYAAYGKYDQPSSD